MKITVLRLWSFSKDAQSRVSLWEAVPYSVRLRLVWKLVYRTISYINPTWHKHTKLLEKPNCSRRAWPALNTYFLLNHACLVQRFTGWGALRCTSRALWPHIVPRRGFDAISLNYIVAIHLVTRICLDTPNTSCRHNEYVLIVSYMYQLDEVASPQSCCFMGRLRRERPPDCSTLLESLSGSKANSDVGTTMSTSSQMKTICLPKYCQSRSFGHFVHDTAYCSQLCKYFLMHIERNVHFTHQCRHSYGKHSSVWMKLLYMDSQNLAKLVGITHCINPIVSFLCLSQILHFSDLKTSNQNKHLSGRWQLLYHCKTMHQNCCTIYWCGFHLCSSKALTTCFNKEWCYSLHQPFDKL